MLDGLRHVAGEAESGIRLRTAEHDDDRLATIAKQVESAAGLILIDEASRVGDELYRAVRPMLANIKGDLWLMSTPYGKQGFFFHAWSDTSQHWTRVSVKATDCPRFTAEFLAEERQVHGESWFSQEYMCEFMESETNIFTYEEIQRAFTTKEILWKL